MTREKLLQEIAAAHNALFEVEKLKVIVSADAERKVRAAITRLHKLHAKLQADRSPIWPVQE